MLSPTLALPRRLYPAPYPLLLLPLVLVLLIATLPALPRPLPLPAAPPVPTTTRPHLNTLSDLPLALQYHVSATLGADDPTYGIAANDDGSYRATNAAQRLVATLEAGGMTLQVGEATWRVGLTAWGRGESLRPIGPVAATRVAANKLELRHTDLQAWYRNGPLGLQQGWTLDARPSGDGLLALALASNGTLRPTLEPTGRDLVLRDVRGTVAMRYGGLLVYDVTGRELAAHFAATDGTLSILVDDRDAVYPLTVDPWSQSGILTASDGVSGDLFGYAVALSADGATVVVGACRRVPDAGAVYVFVRPADGWATATQSAILTASDAGVNDSLGYAVALSADGTTVVAGAIGRATDMGAVYVFVRPAGGWVTATQNAILTASDGVSDDHLGGSVAMSADGATVVAGANGRASATYGFVRPAGGWATATQNAILTASDKGIYLGTSVALSADGATVIAGAMGSVSGTGAAYIFGPPVISVYAVGRPSRVPTSANFVLTLAEPVNPTLPVSFTLGGTASYGIDYTLSGATISGAQGSAVIPAGTSSLTLTVTPVVGGALPVNLSIILTLATNPGYLLGTSTSASMTILPSVSISVLGHPSRAPTPANFVLTRSGRSDQALPVSFTLGGTASYNADYTLNGATTTGSTGSVVFPIGTNSLTLTVSPVGGSRPVGLSLILTLTFDPGYVLDSSASATMTILPSVSISAAGSPSRYGPTPGAFTVTRSGATDQALAVNFTISGTASFGASDGYTIDGASVSGSTGSLTIPAGSARVAFNVTPASEARPGGTILITLADDTPYLPSAPLSAGLTIDGKPPPAWLVLLYLAGDDVAPNSVRRSLTPDLERLRTSLPYNPNARIVVLFDGQSVGDSRLYLRTPVGLEDVTATAQASPLWYGGFPTDSELDTGSVATLQNFIRWARTTYAGSPHTMLALVDHGGGWAPDLSANPQPGSTTTHQVGGTRGLSLDRLSGHSLSTRNSSEVFVGLEGLGHFELLFLDACLMGMVESTYELRSFTDYLVAGENLLWSAFPYNRYLASGTLTAATTSRAFAELIVEHYNEPTTGSEPYTIAALDTSKLQAVALAVDNLGAALSSALDTGSTNTSTLRFAYSATQKFDYDGSLSIGVTEGYVDLADFAEQLQARQLVPVAAQAVVDAVRATVVVSKTVSGTTYTGQDWDLAHATGLAIYLPLGERDCRPTGKVRSSEADPPVIAPCQAPVAALGQQTVEPQLRYYGMAGQLAFTSAGGAPQWAALLNRLDTDTPDRTEGDFGPIIPMPSVVRTRAYLPLLWR